ALRITENKNADRNLGLEILFAHHRTESMAELLEANQSFPACPGPRVGGEHFKRPGRKTNPALVRRQKARQKSTQEKYALHLLSLSRDAGYLTVGARRTPFDPLSAVLPMRIRYLGGIIPGRAHRTIGKGTRSDPRWCVVGGCARRLAL